MNLSELLKIPAEADLVSWHTHHRKSGENFRNSPREVLLLNPGADERFLQHESGPLPFSVFPNPFSGESPVWYSDWCFVLRFPAESGLFAFSQSTPIPQNPANRLRSQNENW